jgi:hypothetical protein
MDPSAPQYNLAKNRVVAPFTAAPRPRHPEMRHFSGYQGECPALGEFVETYEGVPPLSTALESHAIVKACQQSAIAKYGRLRECPPAPLAGGQPAIARTMS